MQQEQISIWLGNLDDDTFTFLTKVNVDKSDATIKQLEGIMPDAYITKSFTKPRYLFTVTEAEIRAAYNK